MRFISILVLIFIGSLASANTVKRSKNLNFDALKLNGKYHNSVGLSVVVESEKIAKEILPFRKDFKDRIRQMGRLKN